MRKYLIAFLLSILFCCVASAMDENDPIHIFYAGPEGAVRTALTLSKDFRIVSMAVEADVLVLNGTVPDPEGMAGMLRSGTGLVLIAGPDLTAESVGELLGAPVTLEQQTDPLSVTAAEGVQDPTAEEIVWNSSPQIRNRAILRGVPMDPIVVGYGDRSPILWSGTVGEGKLFYFAGFLNGTNTQVEDWPYFNYLVYQLASRAGGSPALSFAQYPASPVPHPRERNILFAILGLTLVTAWTIFWFVRRYSLAHPEALDVLVTKKKAFETRQAKTDWEDIGFHRPLGGFLMAMTVIYILVIPWTIYETMILRVYILPSAQAMGIYGRVTQLFALIWVLFDMGTNIAFIKFFSQYRVHDPRRAIKFGQFYVWWQALTGTIQIALVTAFASLWLPQTSYALYAWITIAHCMIQVPGFFYVFRHSLSAWQRFDYAQVIELAVTYVFPILTQPIIVLAMVAWGRAHPAVGASMGGLYGMAIAAYATQILVFLVGYLLYRRLGYSVRVLFLAHFDFATIKEAFRFGVFIMIKSVAYTTGQAVEIIVITAYLVNYNEVWGNWELARSFVVTYGILMMLNNNLIPAISEAVSNARMKLSQYYAVMAHKWGGLVSGFLCATLLAVVNRFILGTTGPEFERAAGYAIPYIIFMALVFPTWAYDTIAEAANRPYLTAILTAFEQISRIVLVLALIQRFQIYALIIAYIIAIMLKNIASSVLVHFYCFPQRYYFWQTLVAPLLAGVVHYLLLHWIAGLIWQGDPLTSVLIFIIGMIPAAPIYYFLYGFFGGWDDDGLDEFRRAVDLANFARPVAWVLWKASSIGARISPLHNRFPITIYAEAVEEAKSLTRERVALYENQETS